MNDLEELFYLDWKMRNFKATTFANGLIYFLGRIPLIGKMVPTTMLYREYNLKKGITVIKLVFSVVLSLAMQAIPVGISFILAKVFNSIFDTDLSAFFVWFILFNVIGISFTRIFDALDKKEMQFIISFRISKETYIKRSFLLGLILNQVYLFPCLLVLGAIEKNIMLYLLVGIFSSIAMELIWSVIDLHLTLLKKRLVFKLVLTGLYSLVILALSYRMIREDQIHLVQRLLVNWGSAFLWLILCLPFLYLYVRFNRFEAYAQQMVVSSETYINFGDKKNATQEKYLGEGKKMKLEKAENETAIENKTGSQYLNALLFSRFKTTLRNKLLIRVGFISGIMLPLCVLTVIFPIGMSAEKLENTLYNFIPAMFFILYLLSFGKKVVQTIFVNCDSAMLVYPFYRESKAIVRGFMYRFFKTFYYNGIICGTIYVWLIIFNISNKFPLSFNFMAIVLFVMVSLSILFSFHELFIYYILQPFTSDMEVKNPVYKFVDGLFYLIAYLSLQIKSGGLIYALGVSSASIVYFVIGLWVIFKFAPRTFKLKN